MKLTVIISYYKKPDNLELILKALNLQSNKNFEVIISEDDNNDETVTFIEKNRRQYHFPIIHLNQKEDKGFRKNMMLNKSIMKANTELLAFIDGDCVPHKHFVKEYIKNIKDNCFYSGRSVMLDEKISKKLLEQKSLKGLNFIAMLFSKSYKIKEGLYFPFFHLAYKARGLVGRNWGIKKKHLLDINGFDNDYVLAGVGEDTDVDWRLINNGVKRKSIKNKAIVYHLFHVRQYANSDVYRNIDLLKEKKKLKNYKCLNGIEVIKK